MRGALLLLALAVARPAFAADEPTTTAPITTTTAPRAAATADEEDLGDLGFTSPRSTMRGFLLAARAGDWAKAATHLDLRRLPKGHQTTTGPLLARELKTVLDRTLWVDVDALSDDPNGDPDDGLTGRRDLVGTVRSSKGRVDIIVERVRMPDGSLAWKIASDAVASIPELYAEFGDGPLADVFPEWFNEVQILEVRVWQWIALVLLAAMAALVAWITTGPALRLLGKIVPVDPHGQSRRLLGALVGPTRLLVGLAVFTAGVPFLTLNLRAAAAVALVRKTISIVAVTWLWLRVVDVVAAVSEDRLRVHGRSAGISVIPLGRRAVKIFVATIAAIAIVQNLGYDATGIIAGLGVGGLALALAAQKTVENLFGGVMLIADQPVRVGDVCRFGTRVGTVEDIGLRSTRLRTPERSVVSVPNAEFASMQIENLTKRDRLWLNATIGLRPGTDGARIRALLMDLREILAAVPKVDQASATARLVALGTASLDVELTAYVLTRDWNEFLAVREEIFLRALDAIGESGAVAPPAPAPPAPSR